MLNAINDLEVVPEVLTMGDKVPVYKGGGKDPLSMDNYHGITLTSVIAKVLEFLVLERMQDILKEAEIPHINWSAYRKISCAEAIFAMQETIGRYMREGSQVYMCLYDLKKAFDSIDFPDCLYKAGNGKVWRLLKAWYTGSVCCVKIGKERSVSFSPESGVRRGSVLSPMLFLLIMDLLLIQLEKSSLGTSVDNFYTGGFLHADDICTLAGSISTLEAQVTKFANDNPPS